MIVYRICNPPPPNYNAIDGIGSAKYGGRWNSEGVKVVYTASSIALARSELARHINLETIPDNYRVYEIEIPNQNLVEISPLPKDWDSDPESESTKTIGDKHFSNPSILALKVPSVIDSNLFNYLLNPESNLFHLVKVTKEYPFKP